MNNQRNNNNRRRGRGNNRGGGGGGGNPINRIDSRARGNAPQMLEKYRKLAHEASLNDDRVQTEYYLQFADHYFRVIADAKAQKDEQQGRPRSERETDEAEDFEEDDRFDDRSRRPQQPRQERGDSRGEPRDDSRDSDAGEGQRGAEGEAIDEDNPFLAPRQDRNRRDRDGRDRDGRGNRNRQERRPRREDASEESAEDGNAGFDPGMLPPSISRGPAAESEEDRAEVPVDNGDAAEARKPRRPRTRKKSEGEGGGEELEAVG